MSSDTKLKILNTAETLFAENGIANTSLRNITQAAKVNLAAVNYHFGSKDELVSQVFLRRLEPMNDQRLVRLAMVLSETTEPDLKSILKAFVEPPLEMSRAKEIQGAVFIKLLGRTYTEPSEAIHGLIKTTHKAVIDAYKPVFQSCLPDLPADALYWRLHFMIGVLAYAMAGSDTMRLISSGKIDEPVDISQLSEQLIQFVSAGLSAPV